MNSASSSSRSLQVSCGWFPWDTPMPIFYLMSVVTFELQQTRLSVYHRHLRTHKPTIFNIVTGPLRKSLGISLGVPVQGARVPSLVREGNSKYHNQRFRMLQQRLNILCATAQTQLGQINTCVCVCVYVCESLSRVQLCDPIDCSPAGSSVHGIIQARILEWVVIPFCRGSSQLRDRTQVPHISGRFFSLNNQGNPNK